MKINEIFNSVQGEGIHTGRWATFVRFAGCNLVQEGRGCQWCDTKYSWNTDVPDRDVVDVVKDIYAQTPTTSFIFTGGEPMLYQDDIADICGRLVNLSIPGRRGKFWFAVETNGTLPMEGRSLRRFISHVAISPKLASACSGGYLIDDLVSWLMFMPVPSIELKFVVSNQGDLEEVEWIASRLRLSQSSIPVILQPNGQVDDYPTAARELIKMVEQSSLHDYARVMLQMHKVVWGGERGK